MLGRIPFRHPLIGDAGREDTFSNRPNTATVNTATHRIRQAPTKGCCWRGGGRAPNYDGAPHRSDGGGDINNFSHFVDHEWGGGENAGAEHREMDTRPSPRTL